MTAETFDGQHVVVVGAGSGIGLATVRHLSALGASVSCLDRDAESAERAAEGLPSAIGFGADVGDEATVAEAFDRAELAVGPVHAVVNCAGVQGPLGLRSHEIDLAEFDATVRVNLRGALVVSREALRRMVPRGYGRIVHLASIAGKEGNPGMVAYSATKAGLIGMVKSQGKEYARDGITVNAIAPAVIATPFLDTQPREVVEYMLGRIPMARAGTVDEVAALVAYVISPAAGFTTGFTFDISGGRATY